MGLFKGVKKILKGAGTLAYSLRNLPRDLGRMVKNDPLKAALIIGAGALTGGAAAAAGLTTVSVGTAAGIGAGVGAGLGTKSEHDTHKAMMTEQRAKEQEKAQQVDYNQKVEAANERAYQKNRAALLSARRQYKRGSGVAATKAGTEAGTDETESYKLG